MSIIIKFVHKILAIMAVTVSCTAALNGFTIMLNPIGDAQMEGRRVPDGFERGTTRQLAQQIATLLEQRITNCKALFTHYQGETISQEEKAAYANRLQVDLYIALGCYTAPVITMRLYRYQLELQEPVLPKRPLYPVHLAHRLTPLSEWYLQKLQEQLSHSPHKPHYQLEPYLKAPIKDLYGIMQPAIMFDSGLVDQDSIKFIAKLIVESLVPVIQGAQHATP